jgi:hypothetical protein
MFNYHHIMLKLQKKTCVKVFSSFLTLEPPVPVFALTGITFTDTGTDNHPNHKKKEH